MPRLGERRVLITGASSGIGAAIAATLAAEGARLALLARGAGRLEALADELDASAVPADVTDPVAARAAVDAAADCLGGLDTVVNAAGLARPGLVADSDPDDWRATFDVNVLGLLHVTQAAMRHLRLQARGDVVNLSSMSGRRLQSPQMGVYAASKAAVHTLSEGLRRELREDRVRVTVVAPGLVDTPIFEGQDDAVARRLGEAAPRTGLRPEEVATAVADVLAAPPHVVHVEVALLSIDQA